MESRERTRGDKRQSPRSRTAGWRYRCGQPLRRATVRDESESGIGLTLEGADLPCPGRIIQVSSAGKQLFRDAHVVRTTTQALESVQVGCRWKGVRPKPGHR